MAFVTSDAERMRIDSSGNVGIGRTPDEKLDVDGNSVYPKVKIHASTNTSRFMRLGMDNATEHSIEANGSSTSLLFKTVGTERARLDSSGNLLVGKTSLSRATQGVQLEADGGLSGTASGVAGYFRRLSGDGDIVTFNSGSSTVGSIGSYSSLYPYMSGPNFGVVFGSNDFVCTGSSNGFPG